MNLDQAVLLDGKALEDFINNIKNPPMAGFYFNMLLSKSVSESMPFSIILSKTSSEAV